MNTAIDKYNRRVDAVNSLLCVGLDSRLDRLAARFAADDHPQFAFNRWIIEQTHAYTAAYKPNIAFYEARGEAGAVPIETVREVFSFVRLRPFMPPGHGVNCPLRWAERS